MGLDRPEDEVTLVAEGRYEAVILDIEPYNSKMSGKPFLRFILSVGGRRQAFYQLSGFVVQQLVLENKHLWIGKHIPVEIEHQVLAEHRVYAGIRPKGKII